MIVIENVIKHFRETDKTALPALNGVSLTIPAGSIFGVIGPSGAGKSTLVRLINNLERPSSGDIHIGDTKTTHLTGRALRELRQRIGMIFQHFNLLNAKTVFANVALPLQFAGKLTPAEIATRVTGLLQRVGLNDHAAKYPRQLSGGQKQRVGIARALATSPEILICDEATSALDPETTRSVLTLLAEINRDLGLTIVLITHEMDVVRQICDRVAIIEGGRIVETGLVTDVFLHPQHPATQRLVREAEHDDSTLDVSAALHRLTFLDAAAHKTLLGEIARAQGVDYRIVAGRIGTITNRPYAQFTVEFVGGDLAATLAHFRREGVTVESLGPSDEVANVA